MNGIGLLVLIAAVGQVTAAAPKAQNRDWGWEVDKEGALCYIVQLSPQKVAEMQDTGWEYPSDMPEELVGRATRIVFRIGTALLPQTPSLEEIKKLPRFNSPADVTAQLGPGRISDVEAGTLYNVQQDRSSPALPNLGASPPQSGLDPAGNLIDQVQQNNNALVDRMKNYVRGTPDIPMPSGAGTGNPATTAADGSPPLPGYPSAGGTNKFNSNVAGTPANDRLQTPNGNLPTGNPLTGGTAGGNWQTPANGNLDQRNRGDMTRINDNYSNNPRGTPNSGYGQGAYTGGPGFDPRDPDALSRDMFNGVQNRQTPAGGFGSYNGPNFPGNYTSTNGGQYSGGQTGGGGYGREEYANRQNPNYPPNYSPNANPLYPADSGTRLAGVPSGNPGVPGTTSPAVTPPNTPTNTSATETAAGTTKSTRETAAGQNILPVFFLLSLVVNLYLGFLISKLLKRYRALLANMRGQTTTNAYS